MHGNFLPKDILKGCHILWSKSGDFQLKTLSRIDMHRWLSDQLDLVLEELGLHTRCTQDNEYTLIDLALTQSDSQIITWYRGNPSQGDIWWTLSCRWSTDQPIGSLVWHQSRARWGRERRIHGSHRPEIYSLVNSLLCWWTPLHLLKGQQLALVDLLEPIGDGGVELRLRAFLPLEHAHGGGGGGGGGVGTEVQSPGMCCRRLRLSGRCLARLWNLSQAGSAQLDASQLLNSVEGGCSTAASVHVRQGLGNLCEAQPLPWAAGLWGKQLRGEGELMLLRTLCRDEHACARA